MVRGGNLVARLAAMPMVVLAVGFPVRACDVMPSRTRATADEQPTTPTKREGPSDRVRMGGPPPPPPRQAATFPEAVVVRALDAVQPSFLRCYMRALQEDPTLGPTKVTLKLEVSEFGMVTAARAETVEPKLARCVSTVARGLSFPATSRAVSLDVPLFFRR